MSFIADLVVGLIVFILGAAVGSFLNVVIYRLPAGLSLVSPPSRCPRCYASLRPQDNIPILGWVLLGGQCRYCRGPISSRYPLIEAFVGLLFVGVFYSSGWAWQTPIHWLLVSWLVALAIIDLDTLTLPHPLTKWGVLTGITLQMALALFEMGTLGGVLTAGLESILAAVLGLWLFDLIRWAGAIFLQQEVMGGGDGKLAALIGAWLGWKLLLLTCFIGSALGAAVGLTAMSLGFLGRRQPMPFGPFLAVGATIAALFGDRIIATYLDWLGIAS